jgi:sigma-54 dependent transcriptional regulator, acetoin dehydrogenase operon transcriptional activator AcoR
MVASYVQPNDFARASLAPYAQFIAQSHVRSERFGLRSADKIDFDPLSANQLHGALDHNRVLFQHASPVMETLYEQIANTHSMVLLTAGDGLILHSLGDRDFLAKASQVALMPGVEWSEKSKGTNAIGTALAERVPVVVHGQDHYLRSNQFLTCSCAPIRDPRGRVVGALDVTGDARSYQQHTLALVRMSALMIENTLFGEAYPDALRVHFHSKRECLDTLMEGIIVFAMDGRYLSSNQSAQHFLGVSDGGLQTLTFASLFDCSMSQYFDALRRSAGSPIVLRSRNGTQVFAQARLQPVAGRFAVQPGHQSASSPPPAAVTAPVDSGLEKVQSNDAVICAALRKIERVRGRDIPLMLLGETGTGKDVFARAIHESSARRGHPFVAVNCASIPETLIESELFGYEDGAFTGARKRGTVGKIALAHGGTLFLDEIGDMPQPLQARLLRVLQDRKVMPLGACKEIEVDIAIICATNRNLKQKMESGEFREDLYYRLNGLTLRLPPLRERSDFDALVARMLVDLNADAPPQLDAEVAALLRGYRWPGNLRQLHNVLQTASVLAGGEPMITREHLPDDFLDDVGASEPIVRAVAPAISDVRVPLSPPPRLAEATVQAIAEMLKRCNGNVSAAAKRLGVSRNTIYRRKSALAQLGVDV